MSSAHPYSSTVSLLVIQSSASQFEMTQKSMPKELNDVQTRHWIDEPLDPTEPFKLRESLPLQILC